MSLPNNLNYILLKEKEKDYIRDLFTILTNKLKLDEFFNFNLLLTTIMNLFIIPYLNTDIDNTNNNDICNKVLKILSLTSSDIYKKITCNDIIKILIYCTNINCISQNITGFSYFDQTKIIKSSIIPRNSDNTIDYNTTIKKIFKQLVDNKKISFDRDFNIVYPDVISGGISKNSKVNEGYDSFTVIESSSGITGGRFISKTPYKAALKAAARLSKNNKSKIIKFVLKKITKGSNKKLYLYEASINFLSKPILIFKNDEDGNKIIMNKFGQVIRINKNKKVMNSSGMVKNNYNPNQKLDSLTSFNYKPYIIKEITKKITIKALKNIK